MPKKGQGQTKAQGVTVSAAASEPTSNPSSPITETKNGELSIPLQVKPGSKFNCITDISSDCVSLQITAPPVDGEANTAIVKFFSELLKIKRNEIELKGGKSKQKTLLISSTSVSAAQLYDLLTKEIGIHN